MQISEAQSSCCSANPLLGLSLHLDKGGLVHLHLFLQRVLLCFCEIPANMFELCPTPKTNYSESTYTLFNCSVISSMDLLNSSVLLILPDDASASSLSSPDGVPDAAFLLDSRLWRSFPSSLPLRYAS